MKLNEDILQCARTKFDAGFNCAESVLLAGSEFFEKKAPTIPRLATPIGGGLAGNGYTCGAITGGLMVIGLCYGRDEASDLDNKRKAYQLADQLLEAFMKHYANINCRELSGVDFKTTAGVEKYKNQVHTEVCVPIVEFVVSWLRENL